VERFARGWIRKIVQPAVVLVCHSRRGINEEIGLNVFARSRTFLIAHEKYRGIFHPPVESRAVFQPDTAQYQIHDSRGTLDLLMDMIVPKTQRTIDCHQNP
jgi:hypothetical protein